MVSSAFFVYPQASFWCTWWPSWWLPNQVWWFVPSSASCWASAWPSPTLPCWPKPIASTASLNKARGRWLHPNSLAPPPSSSSPSSLSQSRWEHRCQMTCHCLKQLVTWLRLMCLCLCVSGPRHICVICCCPSSHHNWLRRAPASKSWPGPRNSEVWHVRPVNNLLPELQYRAHGSKLFLYWFVIEQLLIFWCRFVTLICVARQPILFLLLGNMYSICSEESWCPRDIQRSKANRLHHVHHLHCLARLRTNLLWHSSVHWEGKAQLG